MIVGVAPKLASAPTDPKIILKKQVLPTRVRSKVVGKRKIVENRGMSTEKRSWEESWSEVKSNLTSWRSANPRTTLTEIEQQIDQELAELRKTLLADVSQTTDLKNDAESTKCRNCGEKTEANGKRKRQLRTKDDQVIKLEREQRRCPECGLTFFPSG